jgi:pre-mRNA-processing factor SLU7
LPVVILPVSLIAQAVFVAYNLSPLRTLVPGSYCTGKAGIAANEENGIHKMLEAAGAREEQRKLDYERTQQKSMAEQHLEDIATGKGKAKTDKDVNQNFAKGRLGENDEVALDKERLKAAIAAEKKRKGVADEDEAWNQAKRSKTDVTEEDMGTYWCHVCCPDLSH